MTIAKLRRCRQIIASPNYYRDRAIHFGEIAGAWLAELSFADVTTDWFIYTDRMHDRYHKKMLWYAGRAAIYNDLNDYET